MEPDMTADELNGQLNAASNIIKTAIPFINALWAAYDAKPTASGIDPTAIQPAIDEFNAAAAELVSTINARTIPSNASGG